MPRIKRWAPIAHGFNRDPEVRELRKKYADWMGYVWLEMCSIGDLNGGKVKGTRQQIGESLAYISLLNRPSLAAKCIANALGFMEVCGWIEIQTDHVLIANHLKYHPTEYNERVPPNDRTTERPTYKESKPAMPAPDPKESKPRKLDPAIKAAADPIYKSDPEKFARLVVWIKDKQKRDYPDETITTSLLAFWKEEQKSKKADWWPYLNRIFTKEYGRWNEEQAAKHKSDDAKFVKDLVKATAGVLRS